MHRKHLYTYAYSLSLLMSFLVAPLGAQETPVSVSKSTNKQELWLAQLGSESYEARESASRNLVKAGIASVEALAQGVLSENAETAWRAGTALESIALAGDERTLSHVAATLDRLSKNKPGLKKLAQEIHA